MKKPPANFITQDYQVLGAISLKCHHPGREYSFILILWGRQDPNLGGCLSLSCKTTCPEDKRIIFLWVSPVESRWPLIFPLQLLKTLQPLFQWWSVKVAQLCLTLCDPMDYRVYGILQSRILEWVAFPFSRGSSQPRDHHQLSHKGSSLFQWSWIQTEFWSLCPVTIILNKVFLSSSLFPLTEKICGSVQFSCPVMSDYLRPPESQHARPPSPSPTPGVHSDSCPSSQRCHPAISSSVVPFSSCPQSLPASESFQWVNSSHEVAKVLEFQL